LPAGTIIIVMDSNSTPAIDPAQTPAFSGMSFAEVCALALRQQAQIKHINAVNAKMAHEMAVLKRLKFAAASERFSPEQKSLLEEAIDYSLKRWAALTRFIDDADLAADNNRLESLIRPIALGRKNWLFAGSLRAGQRAAAIMSLLHTARLNGHEPYAYLKDVLERLPTQPSSAVHDLLPYRWQPAP